MPKLVGGLLIVVACAAQLAAEEWKPVAGRLMSRFAKDVNPEHVWEEYPRPQMVRRAWLNLNGLWQFAPAERGEAPPIGHNLDERILVPFPVESSLSGIMRSAERVWYRRKFTIPEAWGAHHLLIHFGAVDWESTVWVNGKKVGTHRGGYDPFTFDITEALKPGGEQELVVGVYDPTDAGTQPRGKQVRNPERIYYTSVTGIWQSVWLEPVAEAHIKSLRIVPDLRSGIVRVTVNGSAAAEGQSVRLTAAANNESVATAAGEVGQTIDIAIPEPHAWTPADPFLYDLKVSLGDVEREADAVDSYFGLRDVGVSQVQGVARLMLNGSFLFQLGTLDQGYWPDGLYTAPTDAALRYDLEVTKRLGFNTVRKHVKVEPDRWYYWCDKLGLLVWQDMPNGDRRAGRGNGEIKRTADSAQQFETELTRMIETHANHPSIVMWVLFNEGWGQYDTTRLTQHIEELDPSRLASPASGWNDFPIGDVHDIHAYPGPASPLPESNRAAVLGEFGGLGFPVENHLWQKTKNWGYRGAESRDELSQMYFKLLESVRPLAADPGLSAAIYTQTTDVEGEVNGLMTYDRQVIKLNEQAAAAAARQLYLPPPKVQTVVPTSDRAAQNWLSLLTPPGGKWAAPEFDDQSWSTAPGGFGTAGNTDATIGTVWNTPEIWVRRRFSVGELDRENLWLRARYDADVDVYINGVLAARLGGQTSDYQVAAISPRARAAVRNGENVLAVHAKRTSGTPYFDVGIIEITEPLERDQP